MATLKRMYTDFQALEKDWLAARPRGCVVFTNGCFDILHAGHVAYLEEARALGDFLVLGLNSDDSIKRLKGETRPIVGFQGRAEVLAALRWVDLVVGFSQDTPLDLIRGVKPDLLVKGGDWKPEQIVGSEDVLASGGLVKSLQFKPGSSTTNIIEEVLKRHGLV